MQNRCVITGLGVISAIGRGVEENRRNILASKSGIDHTHTLDTENCYADFAAEVKDFTETDPSLDRATGALPDRHKRGGLPTRDFPISAATRASA